MNKRSGNRILFDLTVLTVFAITMFVTAIDVFAAAPYVTAYDSKGYELSFNENNYALNAGSITFLLNEERLASGERYVYDDGGEISDVEGGKYLMQEKNDGEVAFVNFYIKKGENLRSISDGPYIAEFAKSIELRPDTEYIKDEKNGEVTLNIGTRPWVNTFLVSNDGSQETVRHIKKKTSVCLQDDGRYMIRVYTMDGKGNKTYAKNIPEKVIIDRKAPIIAGVDIDAKSLDEKRAVFSKPVTLKAEVWDERSDIAGIYYNIGGEVIKADSITVNPPFKGDVACMAADEAGNTSQWLTVVRDLTVDDELPQIQVTKKVEEGGILKLSVRAEDRFSGVKKIITKLGDKVISEKEGQSDEISLDLNGMGYEEKKINIYTYDRAGNMAKGSCMIQKSDTTAPVINFLGVSDRGVYGTDTDITVDVTDDSGKIAAYTAGIMVKDADGKMLLSRTTDARQLHITQSGHVTVTVTAADLSNNSRTQTISFTVDKEAPVIKGIEKYDGQVFEDFSLKESAQEMIDDLSFVNYDIYLNGLEYDGSEVTRQGNYILKVTATDEFGKRSVSRAEFTVQKEEEERALSQNLAAPAKKAQLQTLEKKSPQKAQRPAASQNTISSAKAAMQAARKTDEAEDNKNMGILERIKCAILNLFRK